MAAPDPAPQLSKDSSCTGGGVHTCPSGGPPGSSPRWRGDFFKKLQRLRILGVVTRAGRELAIAERAHFAAQGRLAALRGSGSSRRTSRLRVVSPHFAAQGRLAALRGSGSSRRTSRLRVVSPHFAAQGRLAALRGSGS